MPNSDGKLKQSPISQQATRGVDEELDRAPSRLPSPKPERALPGAAPIASAPQGGSPAIDPKIRAQSDGHLLAARRALAVGDVKRAMAAIDAARKLNVPYGPQDDSPERVDTAIRNYRQVTEASGERPDDAARRQLADLLMDQSQQLLRWDEFDEAERLAQHVQGLRIPFGPFESKPEALLERIAAERAQVGRVAGKGQPNADASVRVVGGTLPGGGKNPVSRAGYDGRDGGRVAHRIGPGRRRSSRPTRARPTARRKRCRPPTIRMNRVRKSCPWR